jgi:hypothetical protein
MSASETVAPPNDFDGYVPKKPTSQKKTEANRRNASRSTGPRTARGKKTVSQNALKHGLLAREVVIRSGSGKEDGEEFQDLLERFRADYEPVGVTEEMLVERIATCWWRLARALRAENGEICGKLDSAMSNHFDRLFNDLSFTKFSLAISQPQIFSVMSKEIEQKVISDENLLRVQKFAIELRKNEFGLLYLHRILEQVKKEISEKGKIPPSLRKLFIVAFAPCEYDFVIGCLNLIDNGEGVPNNVVQESAEQGKRSVGGAIQAIEDRLVLLTVQRRNKAESFLTEEEAERRTLSIPSEEATHKLLRYENHIERELYRAMDQLERIQRRRRGESVPVPLNVNLSRSR